MENYKEKEYLNGKKFARAIFPFAKSAENSLILMNKKLNESIFELDKYYYRGAIAETKKLMKNPANSIINKKEKNGRHRITK